MGCTGKNKMNKETYKHCIFLTKEKAFISQEWGLPLLPNTPLENFPLSFKFLDLFETLLESM